MINNSMLISFTLSNIKEKLLPKKLWANFLEIGFEMSFSIAAKDFEFRKS
jgi:hypothetical protein